MYLTTKEEKKQAAVKKAEAKSIHLFPLDCYDKIIVSFSGGKDSLACVLHMIEMGVPREKIELWHQHVDGNPKSIEDIFMDWPVTESYCRAVAASLGIPIYFQWRDGGFHKELTKVNEKTAGVFFEDDDGEVIYTPTGKRAKESTRGKFPMMGSDLKTRWCSPSLKIDVFARALSNSSRLNGMNILVITGERGEESSHRALYSETEKHRCNATGGSKRKFLRLVHAWRPIHKWTESQVWDIIRRHRIRPHPAYYLGFSRVSCLGCIFGNAHQWATVRKIANRQFNMIASLEAKSGSMIRKGLSVIQQADCGVPYEGIQNKELVDLAMSLDYPEDLIYVPEHEEWTLPLGAFKKSGGPT